jgi:hypothetical protein
LPLASLLAALACGHISRRGEQGEVAVEGMWVRQRMSEFCAKVEAELRKLVEAACSEIELHQHRHHVDIYTQGVCVARVQMHFYQPEWWEFSAPGFKMVRRGANK